MKFLKVSSIFTIKAVFVKDDVSEQFFYVSQFDNKSMCLEKLSSEKNIDIVYLTLSLNDI